MVRLSQMRMFKFPFWLLLIPITLAHPRPVFEEYEIKNDPTVLSEIRQRYQGIFECLLDSSSSTNWSGVSEQLANRFKETYANSAFVCHYHQCPRALDGFTSAKERDKHETIHNKRFKCADTT